MSPLTKKQPIKFLLDENVNIKIASYLTQKGFDVSVVPKGIKNGQVIELSRKEKRVLITHDTDFTQTEIYTKEHFYAIIIFQIHPPRLEKLTQSLDKFLLDGPTLAGKRFILGEHGYTTSE